MTEGDPGRSEHGRTPITTYSFFREKEKTEKIAKAPYSEVLEMMASEPILISYYLHELWRNHRTEDLYLISRNEPAFIERFFSGTITPAVQTMVLEHETEDLTKQFLLEVSRVITKAALGVPLSGKLPIEDEARVIKTTSSVMVRAESNLKFFPPDNDKGKK